MDTDCSFSARDPVNPGLFARTKVSPVTTGTHHYHGEFAIVDRHRATCHGYSLGYIHHCHIIMDIEQREDWRQGVSCHQNYQCSSLNQAVAPRTESLVQKLTIYVINRGVLTA